MVKSKNIPIKKIAVTGIMTAMAYILMLFDFPIAVLFPSFLKMDFSDLPAVIITFAYGPLYGVAVELIKNLLHLPVTRTGFIGELANFTVGALYVVTAGLVYMRRHTKKSAVIALVCATIAMTIGACLFNLFVMLPLFIKGSTLNSNFAVVLTGILPFNLLKAAVISFITFIVYKKISFLLKPERR